MIMSGRLFRSGEFGFSAVTQLSKIPVNPQILIILNSLFFYSFIDNIGHLYLDGCANLNKINNVLKIQITCLHQFCIVKCSLKACIGPEMLRCKHIV